MNQSITWKVVPAEPTSNWTNAFAARGPRIGTFDTTIRDVLATAPAPAFDLQQALQGVRAALAFLPPADAAIAGLDRIIAIFDTAAGCAQDDTQARTSNTADHQDGWYAGVDHGRAEARAGAAIGAQQLQERADKVVITNATGDPDLFLQAVKDLLAAVRTFRPAPAAGNAQTAAARDVLAERQRQISTEGWTPERDDQYATGDMASAAACYASLGRYHYPEPGKPGPNWPWAAKWWKPSTYRRNLEKAGALILAEIERLDRGAIAAQQAKGEKNAV